jgi:hypothetical protein
MNLTYKEPKMRKETITIGLPPNLMRGLEQAQEKLYRSAVGAGAPPGVKFSRAVIIEMALADFLNDHGVKVEKNPAWVKPKK